MAIKKESAEVSADSDKLPNKKGEDLIRARHHLKDKEKQKDYEAGVDPQDEQINPMPEGEGTEKGRSKPGGGNRLRADRLKGTKQ
jgi:hypothetical protein